MVRSARRALLEPWGRGWMLMRRSRRGRGDAFETRTSMPLARRVGRRWRKYRLTKAAFIRYCHALALQPEILLLDEPTAGLDPITSGEIDDLVLRLQKEHALTSIVVTHDLQSAKTIADSVALLDKGKVVMQGSFRELAESRDDLVREFFKRDS